MSANQNPQRVPLPIDDYLDKILASDRKNLIITATPGSGKTTRIPPALADKADGRVLCVEPRRLACVSAAGRVAFERQVRCGDFVGYHVRMDKKCSDKTKLCFVTTGMLLQYLCADPFLDDVSVILFDEFHERSIEADIALAMAVYLQKEVRPDLRIAIMSATLESEEIANYLDDHEVFNIEAPIYPLTIRYLNRNMTSRFGDYGPVLIEECARALNEHEGDILAFLPGVGNIRAAISLAEARFGDRYDYMECHGSLSLDAQRLVLNPVSERRRIIFATNVAESSLTVPRVRIVIDAGFARRKFFESVSGLSRLETHHISRASADQRAGRAARIGPGLCVRLWSEVFQHQMEAQIPPEIERLDLSQACLQIMAWNLEVPEKLPFLSMPAPGRFEDARRLLERLGAIESGTLTEIGQCMVRLRVEPRLARWLIAAAEFDSLRDATLLAAWLSEAPYRRAMRDKFSGPDLFEDFIALKKSLRQPEFAIIKLTAEDILENAREIMPRKRSDSMELKEKLARSMLFAYPDRLAQPRPPKEKMNAADPRRNTMPIPACMSGNRGVIIREAHTLKDAKFFICADLDLVKGVERASSRVVKALEIDPRWIPWQEGITARYEPDKDRVVVAQAVYYDIFTLRETFLHDAKYDGLYKETLLNAAMKSPLKVLNLESDAWKHFTARLEFVKSLMPELAYPVFDETWARGLLPHLVSKAQNFEEIHSMDLTPSTVRSLSPEIQNALRQLAPERVKLENGYETPVDYTLSPPVIRVIIQKAFGIHHLPHVGGGKVMVMIHLCAPNGRPAQVTQDIENFWKSTYTDVRKLLRGRYPKHDWPEVPPM